MRRVPVTILAALFAILSCLSVAGPASADVPTAPASPAPVTPSPVAPGPLVPAPVVPPPISPIVPVSPVFGPDVDAYAVSEGESTCSPTEKPGAARLRDLLVSTWGGTASITRPCTAAASGHEEGRAVDWMMDAAVPAEEARAAALLAWLFASDSGGQSHVMARRLGVMYIEHGDRMWRAYPKDGVPAFSPLPQYVSVQGVRTACATLPASYSTTCHRNHVHISLDWDGAWARTSYWNPGDSYSCAPPAPAGAAAAGSTAAQSRAGAGAGADAGAGANAGAGAGAAGLPYVALSAPLRLLDSRSGAGMPSRCRLGPGGRVDVAVTGVGGVPSSGVGAVVLNVAGVRPATGTYLTLWPAGLPEPPTSTVNLEPGENRAALVVVPVGADGRVSVANDAGHADVVIDVVGYHLAGSTLLAAHAAADSPPGLGYHPVTPARVADSRTSMPGRAVPARTALVVPVAGRAGVPAQGAVSVVVNVTVDRPSAGGYATVVPAPPTAAPATSTVNFRAGRQTANRAFARLAPDGSLTVWVSTAAPVVVDVVGWFGAEQHPVALVPLAPRRVLDTRRDKGSVGGLATFAAGAVQRLDVVGRGIVPAGATAVLATLTATRATTRTYVTAWPSGVAQPLASDLNVDRGQDVANLVVVPVGADGRISLYNRSGRLDLAMDLLGYFR